MKKLKCSICKNQYSLEKKWLSEENTEGCVICDACYEKETKCDYCHRALTNEEKESPREDSDGDPMCESCYTEHYQETCPICEDYFDKATRADDYFFAITKSIADTGIQYNSKPMRPGIYRAFEWPMYFGNCVTGFEGFFSGSIELIKEIPLDGYEFCEEICHECVEKYTRLAKGGAA